MMKNQITDWSHRLNENLKKYESEFSSLLPEQLNWKPSPDSWSIGQCIDHIITTNSTYFPILRKVAQGNYNHRFLEKMPFLPAFFGNFLLKIVSPDYQKKSKTAPVFTPSRSEVSEIILIELAKNHEELIFLLQQTEGLVHDEIIITSPASKVIVYSLSKAVEIILAHELRHLEQAKRVWGLQRAAA